MIMQLIIFIIWLLVMIFDYARYEYVWQLKEYRWRNMLDYLKTKKGRQLMFRPVFFNKSIIRPKLTNKIALIFIGGFLIEMFIGYLFLFDWGVLLILMLLRIVTVSLVVALLHVPTIIIKKWYIYLATKRMQEYEDLKVVGITGSYAKTTVKELLSEVLSVKFSVTKTPDYVNTEIGIARFILKTDFSGVNIFVVEMGAYKRGDIKLITDMVNPAVGILTAIDVQHLALFRSLKKIQLTKYELLDSLPKNGLAVVNADCGLCMELLDRTKATVVTFGKSNKSNYHLKNIENRKRGIKFVCKNENYNSLLTGEHNALNFAPVIIVAEYFKLTIQEIKKTIAKADLKLSNTCLQRFGNSKILKDTHNANPVGLVAMLNMVHSLREKGQKIIVITRGMNELGVESRQKHLQVSKKINELADVLVIISPDHERYLRGKINNKNIEIKTIFDGIKLLAYVKKIEKEDNIILFANKLFSNVEEYLIKNKQCLKK